MASNATDARGETASDDESPIPAGHPPAHPRSKKGQSGNPRGRQKRRHHAADIMKELINATVVVREGKKTRRMSKFEAMIRVLVMKARKGEARALTAILSLLQMTGRLDEANEAERQQCGYLVVPEPARSIEEWELLYSPDRAEDRQKYLAMADAPSAKNPSGP
jgi:uncharacterized protein DUF5681